MGKFASMQRAITQKYFEPLLCETSKSARNATPVCMEFLLPRIRRHVRSIRTTRRSGATIKVRQRCCAIALARLYDCHSPRRQPFRRGAHLPICEAAVSETWIIPTRRFTAKPRYTRTLLLGPVMLQAHHAIPSPLSKTPLMPDSGTTYLPFSTQTRLRWGLSNCEPYAKMARVGYVMQSKA